MVTLTTRRWTVDEYDRMIEAGILTKKDHVELLRGEIVDMSPIGGSHQSTVLRLTIAFAAFTPKLVLPCIQGAIRLPQVGSEPEPDVALLVPRDDVYADRLPEADDVYLVIEVADSSLRRDVSVKVPLYAEAGIREVWVVDVHESIIHSYQEPSSQGYGIHRTYRKGDTLTIAMVPDIQLDVSDILG